MGATTSGPCAAERIGPAGPSRAEPVRRGLSTGRLLTSLRYGRTDGVTGFCAEKEGDMKRSEEEIKRDIARCMREGGVHHQRSDDEHSRTDAQGEREHASSPSGRFKPCFKPCSRSRYWERMEVLLPMEWSRKGFLIREGNGSRQCRVTGRYMDTYSAMVDASSDAYERYYESCDDGLTVPEWRALNRYTREVDL